MQQTLLKPTACLWLAAAACLLCGALLFVPPETLSGWIREDGFFEIGSAAGWVVAGLALLALARRTGEWQLHGLGAVIMAAFAARELDWHKAFTEGSVYKLSYYSEMAAPLGEKVIAGTITLTVLGVLTFYVLRFAGPFLRALRARRPEALTMACGILLLVFSKFVDRIVNIMKDDWHLDVPGWVDRLQSAIEEPLEFCLPLFFLLAIIQWYLGRHTAWRLESGHA